MDAAARFCGEGEKIVQQLDRMLADDKAAASYADPVPNLTYVRKCVTRAAINATRTAYTQQRRGSRIAPRLIADAQRIADLSKNNDKLESFMLWARQAHLSAFLQCSGREQPRRVMSQSAILFFLGGGSPSEWGDARYDADQCDSGALDHLPDIEDDGGDE